MLFFFQFGWARPVEVNARNFKNWREGMMYVSLAGPGANLVAAFVAMFLSLLCIRLGFTEFWLLFTLKMVYLYNVCLLYTSPRRPRRMMLLAAGRKTPLRYSMQFGNASGSWTGWPRSWRNGKANKFFDWRKRDGSAYSFILGCS